MQRDTADLIEDHFVQTWTMIGTGAGGVLVSDEDHQLTLAAIDHAPYNHVQRCSPSGDADAVIDKILATMEGHEAIWSITAACRPADLEQRLVARGCRPYALLTGMALDLAGWQPPPRKMPPGLEIEEIGLDLLGSWIDLVLDQWHLPPSDRATLLAMHQEFGFERVRRWLCLVDGLPTARASVAVYEPGCAGIYGVGTRTEDRGRGMASVVMVEVLRALAASRVRTVVLQATPAAVGLYRRLGFTEHRQIPVYALPHGRPPGERMART